MSPCSQVHWMIASPASKATSGSPLARGPSPLWLCLSLTRMPVIFPRLPFLPLLLSWLPPGLLPLPGTFPSSFPTPSWQSLDPAKQKQKSVSITAFCVCPMLG